GGEGPKLLDPLEDRIRRNLRRRSSSGMFVKTPPHYRVSKYYDHVSPTQEVLGQIQRRVVVAAEEQAAKAAEVRGGGDDGGVRGSGGGVHGQHVGTDAEAASGALRKSTAVSSGQKLPAAPPRRRGSPYAAARPLRPYDGVYGRHEESHRQDPDPAGMDRILWIIKTAYELGLADVLGLEGPLPYTRSERVYPLDHRRTFFEGVYSRPDRYESYAPYSPPVHGDGMPPADMAWQYGMAHGYGRPVTAVGSGVGGGSSTAAVATAWGYEYDSPTVDRLQAAAARRYTRHVAPESEAQMYPRSMRLSP
ncbi:hypothetical protein Vretimale_12805, partial [Volvox reticuliferus]